MSGILVVSIVIRLTPLAWSAVLLRRLKDWRMGFLTVMLGMMVLHPTLTLLNTATSRTLTTACWNCGRT